MGPRFSPIRNTGEDRDRTHDHWFRNLLAEVQTNVCLLDSDNSISQLFSF